MLGKKGHAGHTGLFYADLVQGIAVQVEFRCDHLEGDLLADVVVEVFVEARDERGIVLTGGGAMIYGMDTMMTKVLGIEVKIPHSPIDSVARGLSIINTRIPVKGRATQKSITNVVSEYYMDK